MPQLRPIFGKQGAITAASCSKLGDGAAAVFLASERWCTQNGIAKLGQLISDADYTQEAKNFCLAPVQAVKRCCAKAGLPLDQVDLFEINEAFAMTGLACISGLAIDPAKCNVFGGAISLGHPLGR